MYCTIVQSFSKPVLVCTPDASYRMIPMDTTTILQGNSPIQLWMLHGGHQFVKLLLALYYWDPHGHLSLDDFLLAIYGRTYLCKWVSLTCCVFNILGFEFKK